MYKLFAVSCLIVAAFAKPAIIESGIPVVKTVVQQPGIVSVVQQPGTVSVVQQPGQTVSVQQHTVESQHVHGIPTSVSSQRQTVVQKSVSHLSPHIVGTQTVVGTPSIISSPAVLRTPSSGTVSVQQHTVESQHVHGIPTSVSSQRQTVVQKSVSDLSPHLVGTQTVVGTPSIISSPAVIRTPSPGTVSVQQHTVESQHVHGIPTSVSSQRQTVVQKSVSHLSPHVVGTQTVVGTPSIISSPTVLRTPSIVSTQQVVGTPSLVSTPAVVQSYGSPISSTTVVQSQPTIVSHL